MAWKTKVPSRFLLGFDRYLDPDESCIGVERICNGGGTNCWKYIDENANSVLIEDDYFTNHLLYKNITTIQETHYYSNGTEITEETYNKEATVNKFKVDEEYIRIPKFYYKYEKNRYWIWIPSEEDVDENHNIVVKNGFKIHPAFLKGTRILKYIYIGKYQSIVTYSKAFSTSRVGNADNGYPSVGYDFDTYKTYCSNRNNAIATNNVYHMIDIYELNAIQLLALIEYKTTDIQKTIWTDTDGIQYTNYGAVYGRQIQNKTIITETSTETEKYDYNKQAWYRDIRHLWGNYWQYVDGIYTDKSGYLNVYTNNGAFTGDDELGVIQTSEMVQYKNISHSKWIMGCDYGFYYNTLDSHNHSYNNNENACYDFSGLFIPDMKSIVASDDYHEEIASDKKEINSATFSDTVYLPEKYDQIQYCGFGGSYLNTGYESTKMNLEAGLFSYKFNFVEKTSYVSSQSSALSDYSMACTRLCKYNTKEVDYS